MNVNHVHTHMLERRTQPVDCYVDECLCWVLYGVFVPCPPALSHGTTQLRLGEGTET